MADFLLELLSEEIPARMQDKAREDLARLFAAEIGKAGLKAEAIETYATPRRPAASFSSPEAPPPRPKPCARRSRARVRRHRRRRSKASCARRASPASS